MNISLIIVNYKMADYIAACLKSIKKQCAKSQLKMYVVVVDNDSNDHIADVITAADMKNLTGVYLNKNLGYGGGVNAGIRAVKADYYFVVNPDLIFFEQNTLDRLYRFMEDNSKIGMAVPKLLNTDGSLQYSCWRFPTKLVPLYRRTNFGKTKIGQKALTHFQMRDWDHAQTRPVDCAMGSAMFVRGSALKKTGLMPEEYFMYFEDMDWCRSFWKHNLPVYYTHDIRIRHHWKRDSAKVAGLKSILLNPLTRTHIKSWIKYMWKWRGVPQ